MTMTHSHLTDDRLIDVCLNAAPERHERQHLDRCEECTRRHAELARILADVGNVATAEADAVFSSDRLAKQRTHIFERIEHEGRPGRVISFPAGHGPDPAAVPARAGMRWIAGAAAAGLLIGIVAGRVVDDLTEGRAATSPAMVSMQAPASESARPVSTTMSEEEFLGQLELAAQGSRSPALRPLDDMTPLVWEVAAR